MRRVNNLEKANTTHLTRYAEVAKKNEALEKVRSPLLPLLLSPPARWPFDASDTPRLCIHRRSPSNRSRTFGRN